MIKSTTAGRALPRPAAAPSPNPLAKSAEALLKVLWDSIDVGLSLYDATGTRLMVNAAGRRILGPSGAADVTGRVVYIADGVTVMPDAEWPLWRALGGETVRAQELMIRDDAHPEGRRMTISAYPIPLDGAPGALIAFADVTAAWHAERTNSATLDQLSMLLDGAAGYVILQLAPDGQISSWSTNAEELLGYTAQEAIGQPYAIFFPAADVAAGVPAESMARARADGRAQTGGARVRKDGTTFWADGVLTAMRGCDGEIVAFVKVLHDVTPRYQAERAVESLYEELRELNEGLSYSVSHDLRGPIRAINGFSRLLRERHLRALDDEGQLLLGRIEQSAVRMGHLIDALLRYSRMQRQPMRVQAVDLAALVRRCWLDVLDECPRGQAELKLGELPVVSGDEQLLRQVWTNLLDNAVKFSRREPHPVVTIRSRRDGDELVFEVQDNGIGFDQRYAGKLFSVFQRIHPNENHPGVGIGLAIVHRLIRRHGGRVWASSEPGRNGAVFGFSLPVAREVTAVVPDGR